MARTNDAWYTPFCTNFHHVFPCCGKIIACRLCLVCTRLFSLSRATQYFFSSEKRNMGSQRVIAANTMFRAPIFLFLMREKEKPPRPVKKKKAQGADLREPQHPRFAPPIGTLYSGCEGVTSAVLLFVLSSSACEESGHPSVKSALWYAERMARTNDAWYTPFYTNFHDVFLCGGKTNACRLCLVCNRLFSLSRVTQYFFSSEKRNMGSQGIPSGWGKQNIREAPLHFADVFSGGFLNAAALFETTPAEDR